MFDFFSLLVAIIALIVTRKAFNQIAVLSARIDVLEGAAVRTRAAVVPPPPLVRPNRSRRQPTAGRIAPWQSDWSSCASAAGASSMISARSD
jgi:hypothetical protein